ncbi:MAG TPA: Hsp20/alpha crystallin family protein [Vicinamibacteria bacterium]
MAKTQALQAREKQELQREREATRAGLFFRPDIDILERSDGYVIYADLPGVDDKSVDVRFDRGTLTLDAQLATFPDAQWEPVHTEYRLGTFHREFQLSEDIDSSGVSAKMHNGVLELVLPKSAAHRPRAIPVRAG